MTGKRPPELDGPPLDESVAYLWGDFCALSATRHSGGFGISGLTYCEIEAYARLNDIDFEPWEVGAIMAVDGVFKEVASERAASQSKG